MTQKQIILEYIDLHGSILPAKMAGKVFKGEMFGSETSKRCRELRKEGLLQSHSEGKFEVFERYNSPTSSYGTLGYKEWNEAFKEEPQHQLFPVDQLNIKQ